MYQKQTVIHLHPKYYLLIYLNMKTIPYNTQNISLLDKFKVFLSLSDPYLTQGPAIKKFEEEIAEYLDVKHVIAVCNGTAALHIINLAVGYVEGEIGLTSPNTFVATSNGVVYSGGIPAFSDISDSDFNLDIMNINIPKTGKLKTISPVHFGGFPVDLKKLRELHPNSIIIEDAAHAIGSEYFDGNSWQKIGSCKYSDASILSFHPLKNLTTGEGGAITTNDDELAEKCRVLRTHGIKGTQSKEAPWSYEMQNLGFNYRITDFQCVLGSSQLKKLDKFIAQQRKIAEYYQANFINIDGVDFVHEQKWQKSSYHLFTLLVDWQKFNISRAEFMLKLREKNILTQVHYIPVYKHPFYKQFNINEKDFPVTESYYEKTISIPCSSKMKIADAKRVVKEIKNLLLLSK
ncbi:MAG: DegT/DnrJ/EryC1/StrS family aminotransferase [Candidatus Margulisbacteria bacterium]|nr:DegT/DnrJ/EryC1/StrS family aminotransferase [Candidatus Margulisiibacteriota bacterium]